MKKGKYEKASPKRFPVWLLFFCVLGLALLVVLVFPQNKSETKPAESNETIPTVEQNPDSIAIPGYELLELKADSKEQSLCMPNPPQNMCYFEITLFLEDGTILWKSELIEPGKNSKPMVLSKSLPKGTYPDSVLRYSCYRMDKDLTPLNGAETKVTLRVK